MKRLFKIFRGTDHGGELKEYNIEVAPGMVVLDALHHLQATAAPDLAVRWNCKVGKCGSCGAEVNGKPALLCVTRIDALPRDLPIMVMPMKAFPVIKDLVCDVSWNYEQNKKIIPFTPAKNTNWRLYQADADRVQEFRKCIECFLCQDVCHVLRSHRLHDQFVGPRFFVRAASLDFHPLDTVNRTQFLKDQGGLSLCNVTKCCTEVCPEHIRITDNAIIPLKERAADLELKSLSLVWGK